MFEQNDGCTWLSANVIAPEKDDAEGSDILALDRPEDMETKVRRWRIHSLQQMQGWPR